MDCQIMELLLDWAADCEIDLPVSAVRELAERLSRYIDREERT